MSYNKFIANLIKRVTPDFSNEANEDEVESLFKRTQIFANVIVIIQVFSVFIAIAALIFSICSSKKLEKQTQIIDKNKYAVEAVKNIYNEAFLKNYLTFFDDPTTSEEKRQPFFVLLNTYYLTAIIYNSNIANNEIIEKAVEQGIQSFQGSKYYKSISKKEDFSKIINEIDSMTNTFKNFNIKIDTIPFSVMDSNLVIFKYSKP